MKLRKILGIVLVIAVGAMAVVAAQARTSGPSKADFDGRTLFRGLFLGTGPVAQAIPEIRDAEIVRPAELAVIEPALFSRIEAADATFFDRFEAGIESGDHALVRASYQEGAEQLEQALRAEMKASNPHAAALLAGSTGRADAGIAFVFAAVAVAVWAWFWTIHTNAGQDARLWTDQLMDSIATRLAA